MHCQLFTSICVLYLMDASSTSLPWCDSHKYLQTLPDVPWVAKSPLIENHCFPLFLKSLFIYFWGKERAHKPRRDRERARERIPSGLHTVSTEPDVGLDPTNCETMTWAKLRVGHLTDWATQVPWEPLLNWSPYHCNREIKMFLMSFKNTTYIAC